MKLQTFPLKNTFHKRSDLDEVFHQIFDTFDEKFDYTTKFIESNSPQISDKITPTERTIRLLVPNLSKEELNIELHKNELEVSYKPLEGNIKIFAPKPFSKIFIIGQELDLDKIDVSLDKGVLHILIPKKEIIEKKFETKKLEIN